MLFIETTVGLPAGKPFRDGFFTAGLILPQLRKNYPSAYFEANLDKYAAFTEQNPD
jgi:hypothetical protein